MSQTPPETIAPKHSVHRILQRFIFAHIPRAVIAALLLMPVIASAQDVTEAALKAAFIYNFAKFTEWPADQAPTAGPFLMCVLGDSAVGEALERAVKGRVLIGRMMSVVHLEAAATPQRGCHVLYVSGVSAVQAARIVAAVRDAPVLTIGDFEGFTELGAIAQFFFERGQLRFNIRYDAAKRSGLQISAKLLTLAKPK